VHQLGLPRRCQEAVYGEVGMETMRRLPCWLAELLMDVDVVGSRTYSGRLSAMA